MISRRYHAIIYKGQKLVNDLIYMGCLREFVRLNWVNLVFRHVGGDATSLCANVFSSSRGGKSSFSVNKRSATSRVVISIVETKF